VSEYLREGLWRNDTGSEMTLVRPWGHQMDGERRHDEYYTLPGIWLAWAPGTFGHAVYLVSLDTLTGCGYRWAGSGEDTTP